MSYNIFPRFYDKVMDQSVYGEWLSFVDRKTAPNETLEILELACGTGIIAVELAKKGHRVTGLDLSEEMLTLAYERKENEQVPLMLVEGDMRELEIYGSFDLVTCFSDSLCYLTEEEELYQAFSGVARNLKDDGLFLFDVHSLHQMNEVFPGYQYIYQDEEDAFLWESFAGEKPDSVEHVLTFLVRQDEEEELFERVQELHVERTYSLAVYKRLLERAGFQSVEVTADFGRSEIHADTARWFFSCRK